MRAVIEILTTEPTALQHSAGRPLRKDRAAGSVWVFPLPRSAYPWRATLAVNHLGSQRPDDERPVLGMATVLVLGLCRVYDTTVHWHDSRRIGWGAVAIGPH